MRVSSFLILFGIVLVGFAFLAGCKKTSLGTRFAKFKINEHPYQIELAQTPLEQEKGLSGRTSIGSDGMLFIFDHPKIPAFWMIDMKFDLDFIWIKDGKVLEIMRDVKKPTSGQTSSQLPLYRPKQSANMMLEVNAGFSEKESIKVGDSVQLIRNP